MRVLFAVSNDNITVSVVNKYQQKYKEIITSKNVYYFNAIIKELQNDKNYDAIVISEDLEPISNNNYEVIDKFLIEKLDSISDEASKPTGEDIPIIFICSDRRTKSDQLLRKLFSMSIYNALIGNDRSVNMVCSLINKPRGKKEAKKYYQIDNEQVEYEPSSDELVSESQIQNILSYYKKIGSNEKKCIEAFDSIAKQYDETQLRIIVKFLPIQVKAILEAGSDKYQRLMSGGTVLSNGKYSQYTNKATSDKKLNNLEFLEKDLERTKITRPVVIPETMNTNVSKNSTSQSSNNYYNNSYNSNNNDNNNYDNNNNFDTNFNQNLNSGFNTNTNTNINTNMNNSLNGMNNNINANSLNGLENYQNPYLDEMSNFMNQTSINNFSVNNPSTNTIAKVATNATTNTAINHSGNIATNGKLNAINNTEAGIEKVGTFTETNKLGENNLNMDNNEEKNMNIQNPVAQPVKRGRGRPKKVVQVSNENLNGNQIVNSQVANNKIANSNNSNNIQENYANENNGATHSASNETVKEEPKKGRGRPRKVVVPAKQNQETNNNSNESENTQPNNANTQYIGNMSNQFENSNNQYTNNENGQFESSNNQYGNNMNSQFESLNNQYANNMNNQFENSNNPYANNMNNQFENSNVHYGSNINGQFGSGTQYENNANSQFNLNSSNSMYDTKDLIPNINTNDYLKMDNRNNIGRGKIAAFVGTSKNGTSFIVNNLAEVISNGNVKVAILDLTKNKNAYYMFTNNEQKLMQIATDSIKNLANGTVKGINVNRNLSVFTSLPDEIQTENMNSNVIIDTLVNNFDIILLDCDFKTESNYFLRANEIYLVQSMDAFTIQPLTKFLSDLKLQNVLDELKIRVVINKYVKLRKLDYRLIIGGMSKYNEPSMTLQRDLFEPDRVQSVVIPFEEQIYASYLEQIAMCQLSVEGYSQNFMQSLNELKNMVCPLISGENTPKPYISNPKYGNYEVKKPKRGLFGSKKNNNQAFSSDVNDTLNRMRNTNY